MSGLLLRRVKRRTALAKAEPAHPEPATPPEPWYTSLYVRIALAILGVVLFIAVIVGFIWFLDYIENQMHTECQRDECWLWAVRWSKCPGALTRSSVATECNGDMPSLMDWLNVARSMMMQRHCTVVIMPNDPETMLLMRSA